MSSRDRREEPLCRSDPVGRDVRQPVRKLETFPNQHPGRPYMVTRLRRVYLYLRHGPARLCDHHDSLCSRSAVVESKSLKLYLWSYRDEGTFHEHVTNQILEDLVAALDPNLRGRRRLQGSWRHRDQKVESTLSPQPRDSPAAVRLVMDKALSLGYNPLASPAG